MKDLVTKGTGNSRYMKSAIGASETWEQAREKLRNGTFPFDLNGLNEAGIEQMGMALSKQNLLADDTAAALGLSGDPTVDDAFGALDQSIKDQTKVGDIKITTRTDLGDKWLLCNGERLSDENYSDLTQTLQNPPKGMNAEIFTSSVAGGGISMVGPVSNGNGEFVFVTTNALKIIYSKDYGQSWTVKSISGIPNDLETAGVNSGIYINGNYIFAGYSANTGLIVFYTEDPENDFSYSIVDSNSTGVVQGIAYGNGYWCILTRISSNDSINVFTSVSYTGPWTKHSQIGAFPCVKETRLIFEDGKFSFASTGNGSYASAIFYAENPSGKWSQKTLDSSSTYVYVYGYGKANGYYYAYFQNKGLFYSESIDGDFELVSESESNLTSSENFPVVIESDGNRYYASIFRTSPSLSDVLILLESINIFGPYTEITAAKLDKSKSIESARNLIYINDTWCVLFSGRSGNANSSITIGKGGILPNIPVENAYAYIKAKE